jgi:hypothetical protein
MAANAGQASVSLSLNSAQFEAGIDNAANKLNGFADTATQSTGAFMHFNTHMLESRKAVGLFASVVGTSAGPLMHFVHAFGMLGSGAGGAVAGFMIFKEALNDIEERSNKVAAAIKGMSDSWKNLNLDNIGAQFKKNRDEQNELIDSLRNLQRWISVITPVWAGPAVEAVVPWLMGYTKQLNELEAAQNRLTGKYKELRAGIGGHQYGGMASHIMKAVSGGQLGVLRLEHVGHDPNTAILQQILIEEKKKNKSNLDMTPQLAE